MDFEETFATDMSSPALRQFLSLAGEEDLEIHQRDVKNSFPSGYLGHEILMQKPEGFLGKKNAGFLCKLHEEFPSQK